VTAPRFYARSGEHRHLLDVEPALASWDKAGSPGRARQDAFIDQACSVVVDSIAATADPLSIWLDVGLKDEVSLLALNDLDNYLFPFVPTLAKRTGRQFISVWASKRHAERSSIAVGQALSVADPGGMYSFRVRTSVSAEKAAYKEAIRDQVIAAAPLPEGGVALQLAFVVGLGRAWANLWKPTIDALGAVLGRDDGATEWNTRDGRITELGLHCAIDPARGHDVEIAVRASTANT
jgi:hypothetical protein